MTNLRAIRDLAPKSSPKAVEGRIQHVVYRPDSTAPQSFVVGIVAQTEDGANTRFRILKDGRKLKAIYHHRLVLDDLHWALNELEHRLDAAAKSQTLSSTWDLGSQNFRLDTPRYSSGQSLEAIVSRAFEHSVVLARAQDQGPRFESRNTANLRLEVAQHLKRIAGLQYEHFAIEGIPYAIGNKKGRYDVTHSHSSKVSTVVSGWSSSPTTLRMTLWHANSEVTACARAHERTPGIFLLFPGERNGIREDDWRHMNTFLDDEIPKLEFAGLHFVTLPTAEELATEIWSWYEPSL